MDAENEPSALPPLSSAKSHKLSDIESSSGSANSDNASQEIKRSILQIYPRLQILEKDIKNIKQQLPSELNKSILQIRKDVFNLNKKTGSQTNDINDQSSQLQNLEGQMNFKVDSYIDDFLSSFKEKYCLLKPKSSLAKEPFSLQDKFDKELNEVINLFNQYNKSIEQRVSNLEKQIVKLSSQTSRAKPTFNIEKMRKVVQQQNVQLSELNSNLNSIIQSTPQKPNLNDLNQSINNSFNERTTREPEVKQEVSDFSDKIQLLSEQIQTFKTEFKKSLDKARETTQNCKNHLSEVKEMSNEIQESATEIESKVIEVNNLCDSLSIQIKEMTHNLTQNTAQRTIDSISVQIRSVQDRIISELNSIKKRLRKCEMSEPLIETQFSNVKPANSADAIADDSENLPPVTFGEIKK